LILSLTNACGCRCVFCGLPDAPARPLLSRSLLIAALENAPSGRWDEVNITGGDPLVMPLAFSLFPELHERRARFRSLSISSAGIPAAAATAGLDAFDDGGPFAIYVSVDGVGALHDDIRRRPGGFVEVQKFLDALRRRPNITVALSCVINRLNVDRLDELADWSADEKLPISYAIINKSNHYIRSEPLYDGVKLSPAEADRAVDFLRRRSRQLLNDDLIRVMNGGRRELPCRLLHQGFLITPDGTVSICGTSDTMILGRVAANADSVSDWRATGERRSAVLANGARTTCDSCTTNCYAWRHSDDHAVH
jgi:MoaA/NifB/PqqE/SkfB family radical SAM enzyme